MPVVPYTTPTGLQIGCRYTPPRRIVYLSCDAERLQLALLGQRLSWLQRLFKGWL